MVTEEVPIEVVLLGVDAVGGHSDGSQQQWAIERLREERGRPGVSQRTIEYINNILHPHWAAQPISTDHRGGT